MKRYDKRGRRCAALVGAVVAALAVGGCDAGGDTGARSSAAPVQPTATAGTTAAARAAEATLWRKWGLTPLPSAPQPPADKPVKLSVSGPVPVLTHIPTPQRVVFITIDDGQEKDPRFVEMMRDLKVPFTMFLTNDAIKSDYGYFKQLQALGNHVQNHTLHHPQMNAVPQVRQKEEVCGNQKILTRQYGTAPLLFRPPYGAYNTGTKTAVAECGPKAIVWWRESMQIHNMTYQDPGKKLRPGDIILAHFRGPSELKGATMTQMFAALLRHIQEQGFAVARLEDYIQPPTEH